MGKKDIDINLTAPTRVGPDLPDVPVVRADDLKETESAPATGGPEVVREERDGLVIATITSVMQPKHETSKQISARAKTREVKPDGLIIETY